jgi:hypothetical protein
MMALITNWFSVAAGVCFLAAGFYGLYSGQPLPVSVMYFLLFGVNIILGTL